MFDYPKAALMSESVIAKWSVESQDWQWKEYYIVVVAIYLKKEPNSSVGLPHSEVWIAYPCVQTRSDHTETISFLIGLWGINSKQLQPIILHLSKVTITRLLLTDDS